MAGNRKNQAAAMHFSTVLKVVLLCTVIGGSAIGYVWQKGEISLLGKQILAKAKQLDQLERDNKLLAGQLNTLHSPLNLDQRVREMRLGLVPAQPTQKVFLTEAMIAPSANNSQLRQFASRPAVEQTP
jgi:cell division protein FtsB